MNNNRIHFFHQAHHRRSPKQLLCCLLSAGLLLGQPVCTYAEAVTPEVTSPTPTPDPHTEAYYIAPDSNSLEGWPQGPQVEATSAILMDVYTGSVLYSKNVDARLYPASITKIMTALLACENLDMSEQLVVSQAAAFGIEAGSSSIAGDADEQFTVYQSLMAVMLESANEMSLALSEQVAGSTKKFVEMMNERAKEIGCTNTHFNNPNGLPDETHVTSAADMAKIASTAWLNPYFRVFCTEDYFEIPPTNKQPETRYLLNHHKMMAGRDHAYDGVLGGKTGYTEAAGSTLVTYAKRGNMTLVSVVMGSVNGGYSDTAALLDYGFNNFKRKKVKVDITPIPRQGLPCEQYLLRDSGDISPFYYTRNVYVTVPADVKTKSLDKQLSLVSNAPGPLLLKSTYTYNDHPVGWGVQYEQTLLPTLLLSQ